MPATRAIVLKRAYEDPGPGDGYRVLVDRLWPRGRARAALALDGWARDLAPSDALRKTFHHDPERWDAFREAYLQELGQPAQRAAMQALLSAAGSGRLTLVYGARDPERNNAVVLQEALGALTRP
ncbi:DUF488 domain-containing protein [Bordetella trematum]|uniref:DUF488 domain-containing protein n=1 Tax=Bordetella trematum TaxID=123899 RepID=UPI000D95EC1A|nr:DUF488 family protein [Bordetella trematum]SPU50922.1 Uncharacterized conserved protein [Bordetella trematum]VDH07168.1 Uncharacterized conserved protein [Bordetella trematum]